MRKLALCVSLLVSILGAFIHPAQAAPPRAEQILRAARTAIVLPVEWDGIWTTADSVYDCSGVFQNTDAGADTLCGGRDYLTGEPGFPFECTGTVDATTIHVTCSGSVEAFPNCLATYTIETHGTRSGDSYFLVTTFSIAYTGTGEGCEFMPSSCDQTNSHGTRTGPAPPLYCSTPAQTRSWGELKIRYR